MMQENKEEQKNYKVLSVFAPMYRGREPGGGDVEMYARAPRTPGDDTSEDDCTEQTPLSGSAPTASSSLVRGGDACAMRALTRSRAQSGDVCSRAATELGCASPSTHRRARRRE